MKKISIVMAFIMLFGLSISGWGESKKVKPAPKPVNTSKVEIDVPDKALSAVENAAPAKDYAFYVRTDSIPKTVDDLQQFALVTCTGDNVANRALQIGMGLNISLVGYGSATQDCIADPIKKATGMLSIGGRKGEDNPKSLVVTQRDTKLPSAIKLTEVIFK
jgi:hypothetical protein